MNKVLICLIFMVPSIGFCCPMLDGTWSSSLEKFESFNQRWAKVDNKPWIYMLQTQGLEVIKFKDNNKMVISFPEIELKMGDRKMKRPSSEQQIQFEVLACTDNSIVLQYERNGHLQISQLHFENDDTYWVYMGAADSDGNSHIREYYTRNK